MTFQKEYSKKKFSLFTIVFIIFILLSACNQTPPPSTVSESKPDTTKPSSLIPSSTLAEISSPTPTSTPTNTPFPPETPNPSPPPEPIGGIELHTISNQRGLDLLRDTNTYWIRHNALLWADIEPNEGDRNWEAVSELESELIEASAQGYEVILIIRRTPLWAQSIPEVYCGPVKSDKLDAFAKFVSDAVERYSAPPFNVKFWEIGNEPDIDYKLAPLDFIYGCWGDDQDDYYGGGYYAGMLKVIYPKIKNVDPDLQVLVGGLLLFCDPLNPPEKSPGSGEYSDCTPSKFLEGILRNGGGDYFDGVSFHAYDYYNGNFPQYGNGAWHSSWDTTGPVVIAKAKYLRSLLDIYGYPDKFLMNTETSILCGRDGSEPICQADEFSQTKANYLAQSFASALAEGLRANIWFSITGWRGSGLVKPDMQPTLTSEAYKFSLQILDAAAFSRKITEYLGFQGYQFLKDGENLWVIWSTQENNASLELPAIPQAIYDIYGNSLPISQTIENPAGVLYIEFSP